MKDKSFVSVDEIEAARIAIEGITRVTPLNPSSKLSEIAGVPVYLKLEHTQITGSFKLRGATNAIAQLTADERARGIVGVSTGNHGRGLAYAAKRAGMSCIICMSKLVPQAKIEGIRNEGAKVHICGASQDEAMAEAERLVAEEGMTLIPPFDHRAVIAGQGTLGLELMEQLPDVATILVPLSGGGLISGVAAAVKARRPMTRIVGISMERGAAMYESLRADHPVEVEELPTLADSLGGGVGLDNRLTFAMTRELVDEIVLVSESEIAGAIRHAYWQERQIVEGGGAVGIAALLTGKIRPDAEAGPVAIILSGGNIDLAQHLRIISGEDVDVSREAA